MQFLHETETVILRGAGDWYAHAWMLSLPSHTHVVPSIVKGNLSHSQIVFLQGNI